MAEMDGRIRASTLDMDSGFYAACTALLARTQALDVVANNLANASTPGYRAQHNIFRSILAASGSAPVSELNAAVNSYGILGGNRLDLSQGSLDHTGNDLDFAIEGPGFFVIQTAAGPRFTRNGSFQVSRQGALVTAEGDPVMGENGAIRVIGGPLSVSQDGTISVNGAIAGKLKIAEFRPGTALSAEGTNYYSAPAGSEVSAPNSRVQQGTLESSNVNSVANAVELVVVQRNAEMMQRALSLFDSEMNRVAAQELPRVGS